MMEQTENQPINVNAYTKTTSVKVIAVLRVLSAIKFAVLLVVLLIFFGTIYAYVSSSAENTALTITVTKLILAFIFLVILAAGIISIVEADGYVNLVYSDHGEKPLHVLYRISQYFWLIDLIISALICIFLVWSSISSVQEKTPQNVDAAFLSVLPTFLSFVGSMIAAYFYYCYNRDIANIMLTISNERESGIVQCAGGKGLLWKATLLLVIAIIELFAPVLAFLCGSVDAITEMLTNFENGADTAQSFFQAGGTVVFLGLFLISRIVNFINMLAVRKVSKKFNELH